MGSRSTLRAGPRGVVGGVTRVGEQPTTNITMPTNADNVGLMAYPPLVVQDFPIDLSGDPYVTFAKQADAVPPDATKTAHGVTRELFKMRTVIESESNE
jgi:hypothetical protein